MQCEFSILFRLNFWFQGYAVLLPHMCRPRRIRLEPSSANGALVQILLPVVLLQMGLKGEEVS